MAHDVKSTSSEDTASPAAGESTVAQRLAIVLAHGGGFTGGARTDELIRWYATEFARYGYVTASISYRLRDDVPFQDLVIGSLGGELPDAMRDAKEDMQAAVAFLRTSATDYGIDPDGIVVAGISAGASMALETAFDLSTPDSAVAAAASISGATDPRRIEAGSPPVAMFNGTNDTTAPWLTAELACDWAIVIGNDCSLTTLLGEGHDLSGWAVSIRDWITGFLCTDVHERCD